MYYIHLELYDKLISKVGCAACIPRNIAFLDHRMQEGIYILFFLLVSILNLNCRFPTAVVNNFRRS